MADDGQDVGLDQPLRGGRPLSAPNIDGSWKVPTVPGPSPKPQDPELPESPKPLPIGPSPEQYRDVTNSPAQPDLPDKVGQPARAPQGTPDLPDTRSPLQDVHDAVSEVDPDEAAKVLKVARDLNVDPKLVAANLPDSEKASKAPSGSFLQELEQQSPGISQWLTEPKNMAVAKDDLPNLSTLESIVQTAKDIFDFHQRALESGGLQEQLAFLRSRELHGEAEAEVFGPQSPLAAAADKAAATLGGGVPASTLPDFRLGNFITSRLIGPNATPEQISGKLEELEKQKPQNYGFKRGLYGAIEFVPQMVGAVGYGGEFGAAAAGATAATGVGAPAALGAGAFGFTAGRAIYDYRFMSGLAYDALLKLKDQNGKPLPDDIIKPYAIATGAATAGLSFLQLGAILNRFPVGKALMEKFVGSVGEKVLGNPQTAITAFKAYMNNAAHTALEGGMAMGTLHAINTVGQEWAKSDSDFLYGQQFQSPGTVDILKDIGRSAAEGALSFGIMGLGFGATGLGRDLLQSRKAEQAKEFYTALGETSADSKVRDRLPEAHRDLVDNLTKDGPVENVHIPVEAFDTYFQSKNIDPGTVANELEVPDSYAEAKATGGTVQVPLSTFTEKLVGTEHYQGLADDVKFSPEDLTVREANALKEQRQAEIKARIDEQEKGASIKQGVSEQVRGAGRTKAEADAAGQLHQEFFKTLSQQYPDKTPEELAKQFPFFAQKEGSVAPDGKSFEQGVHVGNATSPLGFYSQVEREVQKMDFNSIPAKDLASRIKNIHGIKAEELEHMGLPEWLAFRAGEKDPRNPLRENILGEKVTKAEVLDFIRNNGVQVEQKVLSKDFKGDEPTVADLSWSEREHIGSFDDDGSEYEYYRHENEESLKEERERVEPEIRAENTHDGVTDEAAVERDIERALDDWASRMSEASLADEGSSYAKFRVREEATGTDIEGNDDYGWYSDATGERYDNLEEAKIQTALHLMREGQIEGDRSQLIQEKDIEWRDGSGELPSKKTLDKKINALIKKDKARLESIARRKWPTDYEPESTDESDTRTPEKRASQLARLHADNLEIVASDEVRNAYHDTSNKRNKVTFAINHSLLSGNITGNDVKGYSLTVYGDNDLSTRNRNRGYLTSTPKPFEEFPLTAKTPDAAKAEAIQVMKDKGIIGKPPEKMTDIADVNTPTGKAKYDSYKLPGGENYREVLLTLPPSGVDTGAGGGVFRGGHFSEPNVLAHVRISDRTDAEGRKTLFIEEMQSDWHQQGRERGYKGEPAEVPPEYKPLIDRVEKLGIDKPLEHVNAKDIIDAGGDQSLVADWAEAMRKGDLHFLTQERAVPNAPFKSTDAWVGLALKRMLRMAVEQGYDAVAWTPSDVQVERWGTESVGWQKKPESWSIIDTKGKIHVEKDGKPMAFATEKQAKQFLDGMRSGGRKQKYGTLEVQHEPEHFRVGSVRQQGGEAGGVNIEAAARERGLQLERNGEKVTTKEELQAVIASTLGEDKNSRQVESLTESTWERMQKEDSGVREPRAEGMRFFYDNLLPKKVAPKILAKLDKKAKVEVGELGVLQTVYRGEPYSGKQKIWEIPITPEMKKKIEEGQTLFQKPVDGEGPQGKISFPPSGESIVTFFKRADKSTIFHESGHYFLETLSRLAQEPGAPDAIVEQAKGVREWLGAKDGEAFTTEQHEKFAKTFEAYLQNGEAPSLILRRTFEKLRAWLTSIYRNIRGQLGVDLNPEVKGIFDRLLATEDAINEAKATAGMEVGPIEGLSPEVQKRVLELQDQAHAQAENTLMRRQMEELKAKNEPFLKAERERMTKEAQAEISKQPVYSAMEEFRAAKLGNVAEKAHLFLEDRVTDKVAAKFEALAELHGFASGEELARKIAENETMGGIDKEVRARVDAEMNRLHAPMMDSDQLRIEALKAIHDEKMTELLALEKQALQGLVKNAEIRTEASRRNRIEAKVEADIAQEHARTILEAKSVKDAGQARRYVTAERNAAMKVAKAIAKKDFEAATKAKQEQMLNHALAREALRIGEEADKHVKYLQGNRADLTKMPYGFARQVRKMLSKFGLADMRPEDSQTLQEIATRMHEQGETDSAIADSTGLRMDEKGQWAPETFQDFVGRVNDDYYGLSLPQALLDGRDRSYRDLTLGELTDLREAVQSVSEAGDKADRYLEAFRGSDIKAEAKRTSESIEKNIGTPYGGRRQIGSEFDSKWREKWENTKHLPDAFIPEMVNILTLCKYLDANDKLGPMIENVYRPIAEAESREIKRKGEAKVAVNAIFEKYYTPKEIWEYKNQRERIPEMGNRAMTRENILMMALNWGNEGNRDRVRKGWEREDGTLVPMTDAEIWSVMNRLDKKDWDFAQDIWNHLNTYFPDIAKLEMDVRGHEPKRVEPAEVHTKFGVYEGGYFPIAYDFEKSSRAYTNEAMKNELFKTAPAASTQTDRGHAIERVQNVRRPVRLQLGVLFNHLENVIHDLEYRRAVIDVARFLRQPDVQRSIENAVGPEGYRTFDKWLKSVASDQGEVLSPGERAIRWFRFGTTLSMIGFRPQIWALKTGIDSTNAARVIGPAKTASMLLNYAMNAKDINEFVTSKSERMLHRSTFRDRDLMDMAKKWQGQDGYRQYAFWFEYAADKLVSFPLWKEIYQQNVGEYGDKKASQMADEAIAFHLGSGSPLERVGAQRGSEFKKFTSMYYTFHSAMFNQAWLDGKIAGLEYRKENYGKALAIAAHATIYGWLLPAIIENVVREVVRNTGANEPDEEQRKNRILKRTLELPFNNIWLARDIVPPLIDSAMGGRKGEGIHFSPTETALEDVLKPIASTAQVLFGDGKEFDRKVVEDYARSASVLTSTPQTLNTLVFNYLDWLQDGEASWRDLVSRRVKK